MNKRALPAAEALALRISPDLALPASTVTSTLIVYGGKGMGKTNAGAVLIEELHKAGLRFSVLDPLGVWWGVQHAASGNGPGIEVLVLGGVHGDLPLEPTAGAICADLVADEEIDVVIDISRHPSGKMWSYGEKIRFITDYANHLFERQGERMRPVHQVFEEAGRFVPQYIPAGSKELPLCVGAIEQLVELGRNVGIGVTLITQRSARMNKSVSELADAMIAFRTVGPRSIEAIIDWFGEHIPKERWNTLVEQIRTLPVGTALIASPGWLQYEGRAHIRARETFDSSATPGAAPRQTSGKAAKPDLGKYRRLMADTIEKAKADDPRELRKTIYSLRQQLAEQAHDTVEIAAAVPQRVEVPVLSQAQVDLLARLANDAARSAAEMATAGDQVRLAAEALLEASGTILEALTRANTAQPAYQAPAAPVPLGRRRVDRRQAPAPPPAQAQALPVVEPNGQTLNVPQQKILDALASLDAVGLRDVPRPTLAAMSGYSQGGHFNNMLGSLRSGGLVTYPSGMVVALTESGRRKVHNPFPITSLNDLHAAWLRLLNEPQRRVLSPLLEVHPLALDRADLARRAGFTGGGHFNNTLGSLRTMGVVRYPTPGNVVATDLMFPDALANHDYVRVARA